jgi:hypothetical protein
MDKFTKRGADGSVDVAASAETYAKALTEWARQNEIPSEKIETAVEAVFNRFDGQRLPMPALVGLALQELGAEPSQHKALTKRVHDYVRGQSAGNTGRLNIGKGVGGGVLRVSRPGQSA